MKAHRFLVTVVVAAAASAGCATILGVDHDYSLLDAGFTGDADADAPDAGIRCGPGPESCDPTNQVCCIASGNSSLSCVSDHGDSCRPGTAIRCDDGVQCDGGVCCIDIAALDVLLGTNCASSCPTSGFGSQSLELCNPGQSQCASGQCVALTSLGPSPPLTPGWFYACQ